MVQSTILEKNSHFPDIERTELIQSFHVPGWAFSMEEMAGTLEDGTYQLLTMDISISRDDYVSAVNTGLPEGDTEALQQRAVTCYECANACGHCFEKSSAVRNPLMRLDEVFSLITQAKRLGLKSLKFLGPGELFENPRLFEILDFIHREGLFFSIFTKGLALGDDRFSMETFGISSRELCERIALYPNVNIILGFCSANPDTENRRTASAATKDYASIRNNALINLCEAGLNKDYKKQRLVLSCTPVLSDTIDGIFEIYKWAAERNIPIIVAPTMLSGEALLLPEIGDEKFNERLIELYAQIYVWLIREKILSIDEFDQFGVSPYAGMPCNQVACGLYVSKDGRVQMCPGNEGSDFIYADDVRTMDLKDVWENSLGYKLREQLVSRGSLQYTHPCFAKSEQLDTPNGVLVKIGSGSIPENFYGKVVQKVKADII